LTISAANPGPDAVTRALAYPYQIPKNSYVLSAHGHRHLAVGEPAPDLEGLHPVVASGSNQSPEQLARKFDDNHFGHADGAPIPVLRSRMENFDSVYSPHFSAYGSIAATLHFSSGVSSDLFTTWLTDPQLQRMHDTEALGLNYDFCRLDGIRIEIDGIGERDAVFAYIGRRGALSYDNQPVALADIAARGRTWPAMTQTQVQTMARDRLAPGLGLQEFIGENIADVDIRHQRTTCLASDAVPFSHCGFTPL